MTWSQLKLAIPAVALFAFAAPTAFAQIGQKDAPIEITANQTEYFQNAGRGIYTGNVVATQGDSRITSDKLTFICSRPETPSQAETSCDELQVLVAEGNVYYIAPDVRIRGSKAEYDFPTDTITITGDVILSRGEDGVVRGTRVIYNIGEGRTTITAGEKRVITVFNTAKKPAATTTPAATPPAPVQN